MREHCSERGKIIIATSSAKRIFLPTTHMSSLGLFFIRGNTLFSRKFDFLRFHSQQGPSFCDYQLPLFQLNMSY
uniref:Uncharacterized protein n=1 Tax=Setaria italica TaxID=4555 RepID=K3YKL2_SETIT